MPAVLGTAPAAGMVTHRPPLPRRTPGAALGVVLDTHNVVPIDVSPEVLLAVLERLREL